MRKLPAKHFGEVRILEYERRLQVARTVQAARQPEMPLQISACLNEKVENTVRLRRHKRLLYHWELAFRSIEKREPNSTRARILLLREL